MKNLIYTNQINVEDLNALFRIADAMQDPNVQTKFFNNKILATYFKEPSTRTKLSFHAAISKLGGNYIDCLDDRSSSQKGESFQDSVKIISQYSDIICLRVSDLKNVESVQVDCPIINCGAGDAEHPTQAIVDLYTIMKYKKKINGLKILVGGDPEKARASKSFLKLLELYDVKTVVIPSHTERIQSGVDLDIKWETSLETADVVYMTRFQKERRPENEYYPNLYHKLERRIGQEELSTMKDDAIILHPMPRKGEVCKSIDTDPRAVYFEQAKFGMYIRMAILYLMLEGQCLKKF